MRTRRKTLPPDERNAAARRVCARLDDVPDECAVWAVYLATADEVDLTPLIEGLLRKGLRVVAPRWNGTDYELAELNGCWPAKLVKGPHAILEPSPDAPRVASSDVDVWLVPGLAFAKDGTRLGYGGGWYDRMMAASRPNARKIGVGYRFQLVEALPSEPHDIRLDDIVTE